MKSTGFPCNSEIKAETMMLWFFECDHCTSCIRIIKAICLKFEDFWALFQTYWIRISEGKTQETAFLTLFPPKISMTAFAYKSSLIQFFFFYYPSHCLPFNLNLSSLVHTHKTSYYDPHNSPYQVYFPSA